MEYLLKDRQPKEALRYFEEISAIPRGSGDEEGHQPIPAGFCQSPRSGRLPGQRLERLYHKARLCRAVNPCPR